MKISARQDILKPIAEVYATLVDFDRHEMAARKNGVRIRRLSTMPPSWHIEGVLRGRLHEFDFEINEMREPLSLSAHAAHNGVDGLFTTELVALSPGKTRMVVGITLIPRTFRARILVQSLKLARGRLERGLATRLKDWAAQI